MILMTVMVLGWSLSHLIITPRIELDDKITIITRIIIVVIIITHILIIIILIIPPRSSVTIVCRGMVFSRYPIDSHTCALRLSSCEFFLILIEIIDANHCRNADGYDTSQMRLSGKFTFDRSSQRVSFVTIAEAKGVNTK